MRPELLLSGVMIKAHAGRLRVHELACTFAADAARLARTFRGPGHYERGDQLVRAALSICSNIAEACGRGTVPEFRQFLRYARGSAHELRAQVRIAREYDPARALHCRTLESRTTLVIKLLTRLHDRPPPDR